jgi:hypothetical protein
LADLVYFSDKIRVSGHPGFYFIARVHDRCVVFSAEFIADLGGRELIGKCAREVHSDLARESYSVGPAF